MLEEAARAAAELDFMMAPGSLSASYDESDVGELGVWLQTQLCPADGTRAMNPLLIALDDAHLATSAAVSELTSLQRKMRTGPLAWIITMCTHGDNSELSWLLTGNVGAVTRIELSPLSEETVAEMVADLLGAKPEPELLALAAGAAGNPALISALVEGLREERHIEICGSEARLTSERLPRRLDALVAHRLRTLPDRTSQLIKVAAMLGRSFVIDEAAELLRESTATLLPAVDEALASGILLCSEERLRFQHDLVWRVTVQSIPAAARHGLRRDTETARQNQKSHRPQHDGEATVIPGRVPEQMERSHATESAHALSAAGRLVPPLLLARGRRERPG